MLQLINSYFSRYLKKFFTCLQCQSRSSFEDGTLQELVSTGTTTLQQLTEEDRNAYLAHLATLPRIKKRKNLSSMLLEASGRLACRYLYFSLF